MWHESTERINCKFRSPGRFPVADARDSLALPIVQPRLDHKQGCCSATDAEDARRVADTLAIPFYALNLSDDFARIIDYFVDEYTAARTPNPCVMCNNWLKFGKLFDYADSVGAEFVATGHYAQIRKAEWRNSESRKRPRLAPSPTTGPDINSNAPPALHRGLDHAKDQSYVLFGVARHYLPRMLFPLGRLSQTRNPRTGSRVRITRGRQARQSGNLFRRQRRSCRFRPPPACE